MKKLLCILLSLAITPVFAANQNNGLMSMHSDPWKFMEQIFVLEPSKELDKSSTLFTRALFIAGATLPGAIWFFSKAVPGIKESSKDISSLSTGVIVHTLGSLALAYIIPKIVDKVVTTGFRDDIVGQKFKNLIITWQHNKKHVPQIYHNILGSIHDEYTKNPSDDDLKRYGLDLTPKLIRAIYEHFPETYQDKLGKKRIVPQWMKWCMVALTVAGVVKLITSTIKDFKDFKEITAEPIEPIEIVDNTSEPIEPDQESTPLESEVQVSESEHDESYYVQDDSDESHNPGRNFRADFGEKGDVEKIPDDKRGQLNRMDTAAVNNFLADLPEGLQPQNGGQDGDQNK